MALTEHFPTTAPLSWSDIDADERRHDREPVRDTVREPATDDITDIAPLAPVLRYPDYIEEDFDAEERRARLMARAGGWPDNAAPSGRLLGGLSVLVILAFVALIAVTFAA